VQEAKVAFCNKNWKVVLLVVTFQTKIGGASNDCFLNGKLVCVTPYLLYRAFWYSIFS